MFERLQWMKMAFYHCNRYRIIVLVLLSLIMWQFFRLIPEKPVALFSEVSYDKRFESKHCYQLNFLDNSFLFKLIMLTEKLNINWFI